MNVVAELVEDIGPHRRWILDEQRMGVKIQGTTSSDFLYTLVPEKYMDRLRLLR
jgi:hypothetical protein